MKKSIFLPVLIFLVVVLAGSPLHAGCVGVPDLDHSIVWRAFEGLATLLVVPDGSGPPLTEARTSGGEIVDSTIHLTMMDYCGGETAVPGFPREDIWLESVGGGLVFCVGGTTPDENTDADGHTQWTLPLKAGGWDEGACRVIINGNWTGDGSGFDLHFNSPDLNGDRTVNLADISVFSQGYYGDYEFRFDLLYDGVVNLSDVSVLATGYGANCD